MTRPHLRDDGIPTRCDVSLQSPAEAAIRAARDEVEKSGASTALTHAVTLLGRALDRVADHVEERPGFNDPSAPTACARCAELEALLNDPIVNDFLEGVKREAPHQVLRWGADHDADKTPWDWFWTLGYLGSKAAQSALAGDREKALHHTITAAALLANWHKRLKG